MARAADPLWADFLAVSARIGGDIGLVQAAGGNTSLKVRGVIWVKASGTWLAEAATRPIMVPVDLAALRARLRTGDLAEAEIAGMVLPGGPAGMRASVETPFHALFRDRVVLHVHCLATLGHAIARDAQARLAARLQGLDWHWQPYVKPGVTLTQAMRAAGADRARIVVLGNHGLIVTGPDAARAWALLHEVRCRLGAAAPAPPDATPPRLTLAASGYRLAGAPDCHALARRADLRALAGNCAIAPDFVVFFGPRIPVLPDGPDLAARLADLSRAPAPLNAVVLVEGQGALIRADAMRGTEDLLIGYARLLTQFLAHGGGAIRHFSPAECAELLTWEAETYRQAQNRTGGAHG